MGRATDRGVMARLARAGCAVRGEPLIAVAAALLALTWAHALSGVGGPALDDVFSRWVYDAIFVLAAAACLAQAVSQPGGRLPWGMLAGGLLSSALGSLIYSLAPDLTAVAIPSISDPLWLAMYPCLYVALICLARRKLGAASLAPRLDGILSGLAIASVLAAISLPAAVDGARGTPFWEHVTTLAYPVADLALLGAVVSAVALVRWRLDRVWALLGAAVLAWVSADVIYLLGSEGTIGNIADALVVTGALGMAAAARADRPEGPAGPAGDDGALYVPAIFGPVALGVLAVSIARELAPVALVLASASLAVVLVRMTIALRENRVLLGTSRIEATTDALTGLSNRRKLELDLATALQDGAASHPHVLVLLDLNGFKTYNDGYGHGAGDVLLARLGSALADAVRGHGEAYRMGGDEFCVLGPRPPDADTLARLCAEALATHGDGFSITAAYGTVIVPDDSDDVGSALALADALMYRQKNGSRLPAASQSAGVLIAFLEERAPGLARHFHAVRELACAVGVDLGVPADELEALRHAATLHDIGKMAIPDSILDKRTALSDGEWELIRRHTLIGERILTAAPALERSAALVRASHERIDGTGYPDGLAGDEIPLCARIIFAADAFDAMTSERVYGATRSVADALKELSRCAGAQFDPTVVASLRRVVEGGVSAKPPLGAGSTSPGGAGAATHAVMATER